MLFIRFCKVLPDDNTVKETTAIIAGKKCFHERNTHLLIYL